MIRHKTEFIKGMSEEDVRIKILKLYNDKRNVTIYSCYACDKGYEVTFSYEGDSPVVINDRYIMYLPYGELCAVDFFVQETQKDDYRCLLKRPVYISPLCMEDMRKDIYLHCDEDGRKWVADAVFLNGIHYPSMIYFLYPCYADWRQIVSIDYDGNPYYSLYTMTDKECCVIICKEGEQLSPLI